jgi:hypothetical protein
MKNKESVKSATCVSERHLQELKACCSSQFASILALLGEVTGKLDEVLGDNKMLREKVDLLECRLSAINSAPSYALKVKSMGVAMDPGGTSSYARAVSGATHSLVVRSKDPLKTSEEIEGAIKKNINLKALKIGVDVIKRTSKRSVIIGLPSRKNSEVLKQEIQNSFDGFEAEHGRKKDPLVVFRGVIKGVNEKDLNESLSTQNGSLKLEETIKIKYRKRHRNSLLTNIACQVSPKTWKALTDLGKVHIGFQSVTVENESPLIQCMKCLSFGHIQSHCRKEVEICARCGEEHDTRECQGEENQYRCYNCSMHKRDDCSHTATSVLCPTRQRFERMAIENTNYEC